MTLISGYLSSWPLYRGVFLQKKHGGSPLTFNLVSHLDVYCQSILVLTHCDILFWQYSTASHQRDRETIWGNLQI